MDFKKIMDENTKSFAEYYEEIITEMSAELLNVELVTLLSEKRKFGLEKYKEHSFQSNFENAVKAPSLGHLNEEMIDAFNYILHSMYQRKLLGKKKSKKMLKVVKYLKKAWDLSSALSKD